MADRSMDIKRVKALNGLIGAFLLEQYARDEQAARAMAGAVGGLRSQFSPERLIADIQAKRKVVEVWRLGAGAGATFSLLALAEPYADKAGYQDEWRRP